MSGFSVGRMAEATETPSTQEAVAEQPAVSFPALKLSSPRVAEGDSPTGETTTEEGAEPGVPLPTLKKPPLLSLLRKATSGVILDAAVAKKEAGEKVSAATLIRAAAHAARHTKTAEETVAALNAYDISQRRHTYGASFGNAPRKLGNADEDHSPAVHSYTGQTSSLSSSGVAGFGMTKARRLELAPPSCLCAPSITCALLRILSAWRAAHVRVQEHLQRCILWWGIQLVHPQGLRWVA